MNNALERLEQVDPAKAELVNLAFLRRIFQAPGQPPPWIFHPPPESPLGLRPSVAANRNAGRLIAAVCNAIISTMKVLKRELCNVPGSIPAASLLAVAIVAVLILSGACRGNHQRTGKPGQSEPTLNIQELPDPHLQGEMSLEHSIASRRSIRAFNEVALTDAEISQLLWATQGITDPAGLRSAPSAGALYPLEVYVATPSGLFHYDPGQHTLTRHSGEDLRPRLHEAALRQDAVAAAPAVFVITGDYGRTQSKYGDRAQRYVHMEAGHAAQNLLLQAVALNLGGVPVGAFNDQRVTQVLALPDNESPLYLIPVGHPQ